MTNQKSKGITHLLYPYMFMLKEGPEFKEDFLDYSLLILHTKSEIIPSPASLSKQPPLDFGQSISDSFNTLPF